jgi:hypothetical protein
MLVIPAIQEADQIRRIVVPGKTRQNLVRPLSTNKPDKVVHTCHPSMWEATGKKIIV